MTLTSTPASRRWTAAVCLKVCGLILPAGAGVVEDGGVAADDLVDAVAGQRLAVAVNTAVSGSGARPAGSSRSLSSSRGLLPQRAGPPFVAFAVQADGRVLAEVEVLDAQVGGFLDARAGVVEEQQQRPVPQREAAVAGQVGAGGLRPRRVRGTGFRAGRRVSSGWRRPAGRRRASPVTGRRCTRTGCAGRPAAGCGCGCGCPGRAPGGAGTPTTRSKVRSSRVSRVILQPLSAATNSRNSRIGVPVAADRGGAQALDGDQVVGEEGVQDGPSGWAWVIAPPPSRPARRTPRSGGWPRPSSAGVIVR